MTLLPLVLLLACQGGQEPALSDGRPLFPSDPARLHWVSPRGRVEGRLTGWQDGAPVLDGGFRAEDWLALEFPRAPRGLGEGAFVLRLSDGARLPGYPAPDFEGLPAWRLAAAGEAAPLPFDTLWLDGLGRDRLPPRLAEQDILWTRAEGDVVDRRRGYLLDWSEAGLEFEDVAGARRVPWTEVVGLRVLEERVEPQPRASWLQLVGGAVLSAEVVSLDRDRLLLRLPWGQGWNLPLTAVQRIRRRADVVEWAGPGPQGAVAWQVVEAPTSEVLDWSPKPGASVEGRPLRLGGAVYAQGFGTRAPTELARAVDGPGLLYLQVGLDDAVRGWRAPQSVVFEIWLGQELLHRSPPTGRDDPPRTLLVPVPGEGRLRLRAVPAGRLSAGAFADWAELVWVPAG